MYIKWMGLCTSTIMYVVYKKKKKGRETFVLKLFDGHEIPAMY